jgi:hypothetical protein
MNETDSHQQIQDFALVCWEDSMRWTARVQTVNHYLASPKGKDNTDWKVPAVKQKNRCVEHPLKFLPVLPRSS